MYEGQAEERSVHAPPEGEGALIQAFNTAHYFFIAGDAKVCSSSQLPSMELSANLDQRDSSLQYKELVEQALQLLKSKDEKVVASRRMWVSFKDVPAPTALFVEIATSLPKAFCYLLQLEDQCWLGATPELLYAHQGKEGSTHILAGTADGGGAFSEKDQLEHQVVADYVAGILLKQNKTDIKKEKDEETAGALLHLRQRWSWPEFEPDWGASSSAKPYPSSGRSAFRESLALHRSTRRLSASLILRLYRYMDKTKRVTTCEFAMHAAIKSRSRTLWRCGHSSRLPSL